MSKYTFEGEGGVPVEYESRKTTPKNVKAFEKAFGEFLESEGADEKSTMDLVFYLLSFAAAPVDPTAPALDFEEFDIKLAQEAISDFLPSGTGILRTLSGY